MRSHVNTGLCQAMRITIVNRQKRVFVDMRRLRILTRCLMERTLRFGHAPVRRWGEVSIVLTDNLDIRAMNHNQLGRNEVTDVLSFRYDALPGEALAAAEIIVNVERAVAIGSSMAERDQRKMSASGGSQTAGYWSPSRELALYVAHGCDHLSGEDDGDCVSRTRMRRRELRWLRSARVEGLILTRADGQVSGKP